MFNRSNLPARRAPGAFSTQQQKVQFNRLSMLRFAQEKLHIEHLRQYFLL